MPNYDPEIDRLGLPELSSTLANTIRNNAAHTANNDIHVTNQDKILWNTVSDLPVVTQLTKGYMSKEDKIKLDGIENGANNYVHPNSKVVPGQYLQVAVDRFGHVIEGFNPTKLNITVENADRLGKYPAADYAKIVSPFFLGEPKAPTPEEDADINQIVNVAYLKGAYTPYVKQEDEPNENVYQKNLFWIGPNNCLSVYSNENNWNSVYSEVSLFNKALNEDIDAPTKPDDYASFFKFTGKRKIMNLNISTRIHDTDSEYATVFGMQSTDQDEAVEFIIIDEVMYIRRGSGDTWGELYPLVSNSNESTPTIPSNTATVKDNHIIAGNLEIWVE